MTLTPQEEVLHELNEAVDSIKGMMADAAKKPAPIAKPPDVKVNVEPADVKVNIAPPPPANVTVNMPPDEPEWYGFILNPDGSKKYFTLSKKPMKGHPAYKA